VAGRAAAEVARLGRDRWDPLLLPLPTCIGYVLLSPLAMSVAGMLAMKEQYPRLRNGRPWRQKDIDDIKALRGWPPEPTPSPDGTAASDRRLWLEVTTALESAVRADVVRALRIATPAPDAFDGLSQRAT
jgi:hypothetical protein